MKKYISLITVLLIISSVLIACSDDNEQNKSVENTENSSAEAKQNNKDENSNESEKETDLNIKVDSEGVKNNNKDYAATDISDNQFGNKENSDHALSDYSSEDIEYARIWLQLGVNQNVDELCAEKISAGKPLNPDDETSIDYPEDVVQLSGTRLVDGVVTYSSNGDGTVNVYNVPKRWDGKNPAGEKVYKKIIDDKEQVSIDPGNNKKVEELIRNLIINSSTKERDY